MQQTKRSICSHLEFDQCLEGKGENCGDEAKQVHHGLEDEGDWPVYELQDGDHGDEEVEENNADGPADPIEDSASPGEIDVHCVCVSEAKVELIARIYPCQWNRAGSPGVCWIECLAEMLCLGKRRMCTVAIGQQQKEQGT